MNFGLWFAFATPAMILALVVSWVYLSLLYCDDRSAHSDSVCSYICFSVMLTFR